MFKEIVKSYKDSIIYGIGNLANKFVGFLLIPLYTSYFDLAKFGTLGLIEPIVQFISVFLSLGLTSALMRWYATSNDPVEKKEVFYNTYFLLLLTNLFFLIIIILLADSISVMLFKTTENSLLLKIAFLNVFFTQVNPLIFTVQRIEGQAIHYSIIRLVQFTINLILNILFLVYYNMGLVSIFASQLISSALVFLYFIPSVIKYSRFKINIQLIKELLVYSLPVIPMGASNTIINLANRYILEAYANIDAVGLFTFAFRLSNTIKLLIIESITLSLTPILFQKMVNEKGYRFIQKSYVYSTFIVTLFFIFFSSFALEVVHFFARDKAYHDAYLLLPIIGFVNIFSVQTFYYNLLLGYAKKTRTLASITLISTFASLLINFLFIPFLDNYGASIALNASAIFILILTYIYAQKIYPNFYSNNKILILILLSMLIVTINFIFFMKITIWNFIIKFILCSSFPFLLYWFNFYEPIEIERIRSILRKFKI